MRAVCRLSDHFLTKKDHVLLLPVDWRRGACRRCSCSRVGALRVWPQMGWGSQSSVGHYLDLLCAILGVTLFSLGYLIHAVDTRVEKKKSETV